MDLLHRLACQARKKALDDKSSAEQKALAEIADAEKKLYTSEVSKALEEAQYACYMADTAFRAAWDNYLKTKNDSEVVITEHALSKARKAFLTIQNGNAYKAEQNTFCDRNKAIKADLDAATLAYKVKCKAVNAAVNAAVNTVDFAWYKVDVPREDKSKTPDEVWEDMSRTLETAFNAAVAAFETDYMIINDAHKAVYEATKIVCKVDCDAAGEAACNAVYDAIKLKRKAVSKDACEADKPTYEADKPTYEAQLVAYEYEITDAVEKCNTVCGHADDKYEAICKAASDEFNGESDKIEAEFDVIALNFPEWAAKKKCDAAYEAAEEKDQNACEALLKGKITWAERDAARRESKEARLAQHECDIAYKAAFLKRQEEDDYKAAKVERDNAYKAPRDKRDSVIKAAKDKRDAVFKAANDEENKTIAAIITRKNDFIKNNGA